MDFNALIQAIGSVGFPIVACIYMIYTNNKNVESHAKEIEKLRETVENNTKVMIQISEVLHIKENKEG